MKKLLFILSTILLLTVLVIGMSLSTSAEVVSGECGEYGDNVTWSFDTSTFTLTISGTGEMANYGFETWERSPLYEFYNDSITKVEIEDGVTSIGDYAFYGCSSLMSITIPDSVTSIGKSAFSGCRNLINITIPDSVTSIGDSAFSYCSSLMSITIPDSVTSIGSGVFSGCSNLMSITIPDSVTSIGSDAFSNCGGLTSITIPDSVTSIGERAFYNCYNLTSVVLPKNLKIIESELFRYCNKLQTVYVPTDVMMIKGSAFASTPLQTIIYCGTESQWNSIAKVTNWDGENNPTVQYHDYEWVLVGQNLYDGVCKHCGDTQKNVQHGFGNGTIIKEATHTEEGLISYVCNHCGMTQIEAIAKTSDHSYTWSIYGQKSHKGVCICGDVLYEEHIFDSTSDLSCNVCGIMREPDTTEPPQTTEPPTSEPSTNEPSTSAPSTSEPSTSDPSTSEPSTSEPVTNESAPEKDNEAEYATGTPSDLNTTIKYPISIEYIYLTAEQEEKQQSAGCGSSSVFGCGSAFPVGAGMMFVFILGGAGALIKKKED